MKQLFDLSGKTFAVFGGGGILGGALAKGLSEAGAGIVICDLRPGATSKDITDAGGTAFDVEVDVFDPESLAACQKAVAGRVGKLDGIINAVGGNMPKATAGPDNPFEGLPLDELDKTFRLNFTNGTLAPTQAFLPMLAENEAGGCIINISSMAAQRPLTRVIAYSAAKAAVDNFTRWLSVYAAQRYEGRVRVNAIAPGFFLTPQNEYLLIDEATGKVTERGASILAHTPMGRYGKPEELVGAAVWLASDAAAFVTGTVIPIDGGFSIYAGV